MLSSADGEVLTQAKEGQNIMIHTMETDSLWRASSVVR